jgi:two-component system LytT family response regulator
MLRAIIIDQDEKSCSYLNSIITDFCPDIKIIGVASNLKEAELLVCKKVDLVFLDVKFPDGDCFELLNREVCKNCRDFKIIFTTNSDHYALKAFKYSATDYLLKPIDPVELVEAVCKVLKQTVDTEKVKEKYLKDMFDGNQFRKIALPVNFGLELVDLDDIVHIQADGSYSNVFLINSKPILVTKKLKHFEEILEGNTFVRVHYSHLVNLNHANKYLRGENGQLVMSDKSIIPVSRKKKSELLDILK